MHRKRRTGASCRLRLPYGLSECISTLRFPDHSMTEQYRRAAAALVSA